MSTVRAALDTRTLRERCTSIVRRSIVNGELLPGARIVETELSASLGVSRGTLRESLRELEREGLLVSDGRGHLSVRTTSAEDVRQMFVVRIALEALAARELARRDDHAESGRLLGEALLPLRTATDFAAQLEINMRFHELLCELTGNHTLIAAWRNLIAQIEMMIIAAGPDKAGPRIRYDDHHSIVDAVASGDAAEAGRIVEEHLAECEARYVADLEGEELARR